MNDIKTKAMDITLFFPVYKDEMTIRRVTEKAISLLKKVARNYEIMIIDDGSPDNSGKIADELAKEHDFIRVFHHPKNLGYGAALMTAFENASYEIICFTDGDDEYDIFDFLKLLRLSDFYDLIITFRYVKAYSGMRIFVSWVFNVLLRMMFKTKFRDISTGLRLVKRDAVRSIALQSKSTFIGPEITVKLMLKGLRIGEVGIQTFPREFNKGSSVTLKNILGTIKDMYLVHKTIFSRNYDLPENRKAV